MKNLKSVVRSRIFIIAAVTLLVYTLAGFFLTPYLVRHYVPEIIQKALKKQAALGEVRVNPFLFKIEVTEFRLTEPDGRPIAGFRRLFIDFELKSLFKWAWTFQNVALEGPELNAVIEKDGSLNLAGLFPPTEGPAPQPKEHQIPRLIFEDIEIDQGQIDFTDRRQSKPASVTFKPLGLKMKNLTTLLGHEGAKTITATSGQGEVFKWTGTIGLNPVMTRGRFAIEGLKTSTLAAFVQDELNLDQVDGKLSISADYRFDLKNEQAQVLLTDLSVALTGLVLRLRDAENPFLEIPDTLVSGCRLDLSSRQVDVGSIAIKGGLARLVVDEDGTLNMQQIIRTPATSAPPASGTPARANNTKPWQIKLKGFDLGGFGIDYKDMSRMPGLSAAVGELRVAFTAEAETGEQLRGRVGDINVGIADVRAGFQDAAEPALRLDRVAIDGGAYELEANRFTAAKIAIKGGAADLRRRPDGAVNLALLFMPTEKGAVARRQDASAARGRPFQFLIKRFFLSGLQVGLSDLMVRPDAPVLGLDDVSLAVSDVDGKSPMKFDLNVKVREGGQIKANGTVDPSIPSVEFELQVAELALPPFQPYIDQAAAVTLKSGFFSTRGALRYGGRAAGAKMVYQGGFNIANLLVTETAQQEALVGWKSVESEQLKLQIEPNGIKIDELRVSQPVGKILIEKDATLNLARVLKTGVGAEQANKPTPEGPADRFGYEVRRVRVEGGEIDFADKSLPIPFGTRIHELKGSVAGISSTQNARAQVGLNGRVDDYGTAKVDGELNTSDPKAFTDLRVVFRNVEMSRLTPYSGKFAGRKIDSGKLSVDLKYKIDNSQLAGDNQIVVERLSLGEKVESPDAVNLPLDLAVALLEDSHGVIDLGLPVHGNLDSPEFSYGALIGKAIVNLLTKIVTSPFRALAALIPGAGDDAISNIVFEPGSDGVSPPEKEKLALLAGALQKRPQLTLIVQGRYHPVSDAATLRSASLKRALASRLGRKSAPDAELGPIDYSSPATGSALEAMFLERFGAEALKTIKAELTAVKARQQKDAIAKGQTTAAQGKPEDPGQLAKQLFNRLEEVEPVSDAALTRLADARARHVIEELSGPLAISSERLHAKASAALDKSDPVTVELTLDVKR